MDVKNLHLSPCSGSGRGPGRPPEMAECERREKILVAAGDVLLTYGYQAASMDKVAQCSGMSKRTLYQLFPSKQELFHALIDMRLFRISCSVSEAMEFTEAGLVKLLTEMATHLIRPETIELIRAIIFSASEAEDIREIMTTLKQCGESNRLTAWVQTYCQHHGLSSEGSEIRCRQLFGMTIGELMLQALISRDLPPEEIRTFIASGANLFLVGLNTLDTSSDTSRA
ncbi:TetR/AcrR family transcriptional regulator [Acetobacter sp.]|uniref:TetR/AcrR family transcriptional regulator n=1 Tax=Acetobacter sp. TaxID=440 RepID=UPI0039E96629